MVSLIAKFRAGRRVALEQESKKGPVKSEAPSTPYRHVPTHAITDAMAGVPGCHREQDRKKIRQQHRRRSAMLTTLSSEGVHGSGAGSARTSIYRNYPAESSTSAGMSVDRAHSHQRGRPRPDRHDSGIGRSRLSSVEVSPHISLANSTASAKSQSSENSSDEFLSKITEERLSHARTESEVKPSPSNLTKGPVAMGMANGIEKVDGSTHNVWLAPQQLPSSPPHDVQITTTSTVEPGTEKTRRVWRFGRKTSKKA